MSYDYLPALTKRISRLEHGNRLLVLLLVATVATFFASRFPTSWERHVFAAPANENAAAELLTVRGLRLIDPDGKERALLRTRDGTVLLQLKDSSGIVRGFFASGENGGCMLGFHDRRGKPRTVLSESSVAVGKGASFAVLRALDDATYLNFLQDGKARLNLKAGKDENRTGVFVADSGGAIRLGMGLVLDSSKNNGGFEPGMIVQDNKNARLSLGLSACPWVGKTKDVPEQADPMIELADAAGNRRMLIRSGPVLGPDIMLFDESGSVVWQTHFLRDDVKEEVDQRRKKYEEFLEELSSEELKHLLPQ